MLVPIILAIVGVLAGGAVGYVLKPEAKVEAAETHESDGVDEAAEHAKASGLAPASDSAYVELSRKLIVPFTRGDGRKAFVAIDIALEMAPAMADFATNHEPKVLDAFLRTMIGFAATGAFDDHTGAAEMLRELNHELLKAARAVLGAPVRAVLISNLITQDA